MTIPIDEFATRFVCKSDLRSVTVEGQGTYRVYEYEGPLSEMENVKALLSWKDDYTEASKPQVCLLCTDFHTFALQLCGYYSHLEGILT